MNCTKPQVLSLANQLLPLLKNYGLEDGIETIQDAVTRMNMGLFRVVVMGEIKKGKSSFINALLAKEDLLPTDVGIATSTVFKIIYGDKFEYRVYFLEDPDTSIRPKPITIEKDQLAQYGTEKGNPNNEKGVDFIGVRVPSDLLKTGLVFVDTPGVGGLYKAHRDITWRYAPNADAVFFVLDSSEAVISADEIKFIQELTSKVTKRIFFIQTKIDAADEETVQRWEQRNRQLLIEKVGIPEKSLLYFPVSSKLLSESVEDKCGEDLQDSGFLPVLSFINNTLLKRKESELAGEVMKQVQLIALRLIDVLKDREQIFRSKSDSETKELEVAITEKNAEFKEWAQSRYPLAIKKFATEFEKLCRTTRDKIQEDLEPDEDLFLEVIRPLLELKTPSKIKDASDGISQDLIAQVSQYVSSLYSKFRLGSLSIVTEVLEDLGLPANSTVSAALEEGNFNLKRVEIDIESKTTVMDKGRGMLSGISMGGIAAFALSSVFPVAAVTPLLFGAVGGFKGYKDVEAKEADMLTRELKSKLSQQLRKATRKVLNAFDAKCKDQQALFLDHLESAKTSREKELKTLMDEFNRSRKVSHEERKNHLGELQSGIRQAESILSTTQDTAQNPN